MKLWIYNNIACTIQFLTVQYERSPLVYRAVWMDLTSQNHEERSQGYGIPGKIYEITTYYYHITLRFNTRKNLLLIVKSCASYSLILNADIIFTLYFGSLALILISSKIFIIYTSYTSSYYLSEISSCKSYDTWNYTAIEYCVLLEKLK